MKASTDRGVRPRTRHPTAYNSLTDQNFPKPSPGGDVVTIVRADALHLVLRRPNSSRCRRRRVHLGHRRRAAPAAVVHLDRAQPATAAEHAPATFRHPSKQRFAVPDRPHLPFGSAGTFPAGDATDRDRESLIHGCAFWFMAIPASAEMMLPMAHIVPMIANVSFVIASTLLLSAPAGHALGLVLVARLLLL
jgi:hypothetical protein